jgi:hypothetical protein
MGQQKLHQSADSALPFKILTDLFGFHSGYALDIDQHMGFIFQYFQGLHAETADNPAGCRGSDTGDDSGGEIFQNRCLPRGILLVNCSTLNCGPCVGMGYPFAAGLNSFSRRRIGNKSYKDVQRPVVAGQPQHRIPV